MLRRWLVECPQCAQVWLVVGARENDSHVCKDCGHGFVVSLSVAPDPLRAVINGAGQMLAVGEMTKLRDKDERR
jgi:hypothetical protein